VIPPRPRRRVLAKARWVVPVAPPQGSTWPELVAAQLARRDLVAILTAWLDALRVA
jgi:hypothetical protein